MDPAISPPVVASALFSGMFEVEPPEQDSVISDPEAETALGVFFGRPAYGMAKTGFSAT